MRVVGVLVRFGIRRNDTSCLLYGAIDMFELHSSMTNMEFVQQHLINIVQYAVARGRWNIINQHVATQGV